MYRIFPNLIQTSFMIVPVILCGGVGSRLWPISRKTHPKQFLKIHNDYTLFQNTVLRFQKDKAFAAPIIICGDDYKFQIAADLEALKVTPAAIIVERIQRSTCPAVSLAAHYIGAQFGLTTQMLVLPADHVISEDSSFIDHVKSASGVLGNSLLAFGITPKSPATGYGYIKAGEALAGGIFAVKNFVEKPNKEVAEQYIASGDYYWNSGMFLFQAQTYLSELQSLQPDIFNLTQEAITSSIKIFNFIQLNDRSLVDCPNISLDYAIFEKTAKASVLPVKIDWYDLGSWQSIYDYYPKDADKNVLVGKNISSNASTNCLVYSNGDAHVVLQGLSDVFVIASKDAVLVMSGKHSEEVKSIYNAFAANNDPIIERNNKCYRPWGYYEELLVQPNCRVKLIHLNPGAQISLQYHNKRAEHWVIIKNKAEVTRDDKIFTANEDESVYIPVNTLHRIKNINESPLQFVEIQVGEYVSEDDIVRVDDIYQRNKMHSPG